MIKSKRDTVNLAALMSIQASSAALPLLVYPYAIATLTAANFSLVVISESIALLLTPLILYSYEVTGTSEGTERYKNRDIKGLNRLFTTILAVRLSILGAIFSLLLTIYIATNSNILLLTAIWCGVPLSSILQNYWYYRCTENNLIPAIFTAISRLGATITIYATLPETKSAITIPSVISIFYVSGGLATFIHGIFISKLRLTKPSFYQLKSSITNGWYIFLGNLSVTLYKDVNVLILGILGLPAATVANYSLAEKFTKCLQAIARPVSQYFFPKTISELTELKNANSKSLKIIFKNTIPQIGILVTAIVLITIAFTYFDFINNLLPITSKIKPVFPLFLIMSGSVIFGASNFMLGTVGLNYFGLQKKFFLSILATGICGILNTIALTHFFHAIGTGVAFLLSEIILFALLLANYLKKKSPDEQLDTVS